MQREYDIIVSHNVIFYLILGNKTKKKIFNSVLEKIIMPKVKA